MDKFDKLEWIVEEWLEKVKNSKNSYDNGKATALKSVLLQMNDLRAREAKESQKV